MPVATTAAQPSSALWPARDGDTVRAAPRAAAVTTASIPSAATAATGGKPLVSVQWSMVAPRPRRAAAIQDQTLEARLKEKI
jgi:hypothetical protein